MPNLGPERTNDVRARCKAWLTELVPSLVSISALGSRLYGRDPDGKANGRARVRQIVGGRIAPTPDVAFRIGEALRDAGLKWSSGLYALHVAGYLTEELSLLDLIAQGSEIHDPATGSVSYDPATCEAICYYVYAAWALSRGNFDDAPQLFEAQRARAFTKSNDVLGPELSRLWLTYNADAPGGDGILGAAAFLAKSGRVRKEDRRDVFGALVSAWVARYAPPEAKLMFENALRGTFQELLDDQDRGGKTR